MDLKARITEDMKVAMRSRDAARLSTIRLLLAAIILYRQSVPLDGAVLLVTTVLAGVTVLLALLAYWMR